MVRFYCCFIGFSINGVFCQDVENADDIVHRTLDICSRVLEVSFTVMLMVQWYRMAIVMMIGGDLDDDGGDEGDDDSDDNGGASDDV